MTLANDVNHSLMAANQAYHLFGLSLQVFQANSGRHDFVAAEAEREIMHAHLDDYIDAFMAANKRIEHER